MGDVLWRDTLRIEEGDDASDGGIMLRSESSEKLPLLIRLAVSEISAMDCII
jgi:hypothetical protein